MQTQLQLNERVFFRGQRLLVWSFFSANFLKRICRLWLVSPSGQPWQPRQPQKQQNKQTCDSTKQNSKLREPLHVWWQIIISNDTFFPGLKRRMQKLLMDFQWIYPQKIKRWRHLITKTVSRYLFQVAWGRTCGQCEKRPLQWPRYFLFRSKSSYAQITKRLSMNVRS